jgi:hypothetical protein
MRSIPIAAATLLALMTTSCGGGGVSEQDIVDSLNETLSSVVGGWTGIVNPPNGIRLDFTLQASSNGQVSGTGTMKEDNASASVPITVTGTFQRPVLTLTFNGMVYEGHQVQGTATGSYVTVGGIATTLKLAGTGYAKDVAILLQEK